MAKKTTNVGLVKAIFVGAAAPINTDVIWKDTTVGLHKAYNSSTGTWDLIVGLVLIDNLTIKRDGDNKLYVDVTEIPALTIPNNSLSLLKLVNVPTGTVYYRRAAETGPIEASTLAQLKSDLGLTGINSGDQNLSGLALKSYMINGHQLNGNFDITAAEIGAPSGSGNSTGTNTGDETSETILAKLGTTDVISSTELSSVLENYIDLAALATILEGYATNESIGAFIPITLPSADTVSGRLVGLVEGVNYPTGWTLTADDKDLIVTHGQNKHTKDIQVWSENILEGINRQERGNAAHSGLYEPIGARFDSVVIESLATIPAKIIIYITFA